MTASLLEKMRGCYDAAVIFTVYSQNPLPAAMLCYLADIPLRLAYCRENPYHLLTHWVRETEPEQSIRHEVRRQLDLVQFIGCALQDERIRLRIPEGDRLRVQDRLRMQGFDFAQPWMVLHPGVQPLPGSTPRRVTRWQRGSWRWRMDCKSSSPGRPRKWGW